MHEEHLILLILKMSYFWPFFFFFKESVARFFKGKTRGDVRADRRDPVQHPSPSRAMQRQPAGQLGGSRLQTGRESSRAASVQRSGTGWQHNAVSRRQSQHVFPLPHLPHALSVSFQSFSFLIFCSKRCREDGVSKAGPVKTAQSKHRPNDAERKRKR